MAIEINGSSGISGVDGSASTPALQGSDSNTGISFGTDEVEINTGGVERVKVDSSGRLLAGTSTSTSSNGESLFQVASTSNDRLIAAYNFENDSSGPHITLGKSRGTSVGSFTVLQDDDELGKLSFFAADGSDLNTEGARITAAVDGTPGTNDMPTRLVFSTTADGANNPTEHIRIDNAGTTAVWSTSAPMVWGRNETSGSVTGLAYYNTATSTTSLTGLVFRVMCDGDVENANNRYGAISDAKFKENIVDASSQWDDIKSIQVRNYNFKAETGLHTHTQIGLIAQEVELISPGLVGECIDDNTGETSKTVSYSVLYMKAVKALQEAMERIETLEAKVAVLEAAS